MHSYSLLYFKYRSIKSCCVASRFEFTVVVFVFFGSCLAHKLLDHGQISAFDSIFRAKLKVTIQSYSLLRVL
jgi:hypothetical protein